MRGTYEDIINLPHPTSKKHPRMTLTERAAQFSPFAALTGYEAVVEETGRLTDRQMEASEDMKEELDENLRQLAAYPAEQTEVRVTYFQPDGRKRGGAYVTHQGRLFKADPVRGLLKFLDGSEIELHAVIRLERIDIASGNS